MKPSQFSDKQIKAILKQAEDGAPYQSFAESIHKLRNFLTTARQVRRYGRLHGGPPEGAGRGKSVT